MSSRMRFTKAAVILAAALTLAASPVVMAGVGDSYSTHPVMERTGATNVAAQRLAAPDPAVAALLVAPSKGIRTHTVTALYAQPDASSAVMSWMMPNVSVRILGLSRDLAFYAIATSEKSADVAGWMTTKDLAYKPAMERTNRLAMVYRQRDTRSAVVHVLVPGQAVGLLGVSPDGSWAAVRTGSSTRTTGWVASTDLRRDYAVAQVNTLTKTHVRADEGSPVFDTLTPGEKVMLTGRTADGAWIALASQDGRRFRGWARTGEVQHSMNLAALPVAARS